MKNQNEIQILENNVKFEDKAPKQVERPKLHHLNETGETQMSVTSEISHKDDSLETYSEKLINIATSPSNS